MRIWLFLYVYFPLIYVGKATPNFFLGTPIYQEYNALSVVCLFNGSSLFHGDLRCSINGNTPFLPPFDDGCVAITVTAVSPGSSWTVSAALRSCDQVQLRCGNVNADGSRDLSLSLNLSVLTRALQVLAPLPASMEEMQRDVICVSNGITHPHISWTINYQVVHGSATIDGWTFVPFTTSNQVNISFLDTWQSAASGRLSSNGSKNENITIHCRHRLANGEYNYSAPLMFRLEDSVILSVSESSSQCNVNDTDTVVPGDVCSCTSVVPISVFCAVLLLLLCIIVTVIVVCIVAICYAWKLKKKLAEIDTTSLSTHSQVQLVNAATRNVSMTEGRETAPVVQATTSIYTNSDANGTH